MQKRMYVEERFEVLGAETLIEVQGGASGKDGEVVATIRNAILELLGLNPKNDK